MADGFLESIRKILKTGGKMRGPFEDIEWKGDPLTQFIDAGSEMGDAVRNVPFPPIQIAGAAVNDSLNLVKIIHKTGLDLVQINAAMYRSAPEVQTTADVLEELQNVALGKFE